MEESILIRSQMLETYSMWFALLMKCLLVSAGLLLVAAIVLIGLGCKQTVREGRRKKQEPPGRSYPRLHVLPRRPQGIAFGRNARLRPDVLLGWPRGGVGGTTAGGDSQSAGDGSHPGGIGEAVKWVRRRQKL